MTVFVPSRVLFVLRHVADSVAVSDRDAMRFCEREGLIRFDAFLASFWSLTAAGRSELRALENRVLELGLSL